MPKTKSTTRNLGLLMVFFALIAAGEHKLVKVKVNDRITVLVPKEWQPMDQMDLVQRYPSVRAPLAAYTNMERDTDFSVNISATQWPDDDVDLARQFFKAGIMNMFDRVEMLDEGTRAQGGKKFIYFEFESRVNGNRRQEELRDPVIRYTYIQYLIEPGQAIVFTFSCPRRLKDQWQSTAHEMMEGIKMSNKGK